MQSFVIRVDMMSEQKPKEKHIPKTKSEKNKETIQAIAKNYKQWEKSIAEQLLLNVPNHGTSTGKIWIMSKDCTGIWLGEVYKLSEYLNDHGAKYKLS